MKQNQQFRGLGLVVLVMALILFASSLTQKGGLFSEEMTYQQFMMAVENGTIVNAQIRQNPQTPTGLVELYLKDGDRNEVAVSDVIETQKLLSEHNISFVVEDVPQENFLLSVILPIGLSAVVIMFLMMYGQWKAAFRQRKEMSSIMDLSSSSSKNLARNTI